VKKYELVLSLALNKDLLLKASKIALIVGIILNVINQGEGLVTLDSANINFTKLLFTFCVPFCVSMYTAVSMKMKFKANELAILDAQVKCKNCKQTIFIKKDQNIPLCTTCLEKTSWVFLK